MIRFWDRTAFICLCLMIFCLPFTKAGLQTFAWVSVFACLMKRVHGYRTDGFWGFVPRTFLDKGLVAFLLVNVMATVFSPDWGLSSKALFGKILKYVLMYYVVVETINDVRRVKNVLWVLLFSAVFISADALFQAVRGVDLLRGYPLIRLSGPFLAPNDFGGWLIMLIPILLGVSLVHRAYFSGKIRVAFFGMAMVLFGCLVASYTRGAWLGLFVALLWGGGYLWFRMNIRLKVRSLLAIVVVVSLALLFPHRIAMFIDRVGNFQARVGSTLGDRIRSLPNLKEKGIDDRMNLWKEALAIWKDHPVTGCGLNNYSIVARDYKSFSYGGIYPHNSFLQMLAETGVLGLAAFLWVLVVFFREGWRHVKARGDVLVLGTLCAILGFLVHSFFDTNLYALPLVMLLWYMVGLTVAMMKIFAADQAKEDICLQK